MKKNATKAVSTKAFETQHIEIEPVKVYQVRPLQNGFAIYMNGEACDKHGYIAKTEQSVFIYRNEKLAFECLAIFKCK